MANNQKKGKTPKKGADNAGAATAPPVVDEASINAAVNLILGKIEAANAKVAPPIDKTPQKDVTGASTGLEVEGGQDPPVVPLGFIPLSNSIFAKIEKGGQLHLVCNLNTPRESDLPNVAAATGGSRVLTDAVSGVNLRISCTVYDNLLT